MSKKNVISNIQRKSKRSIMCTSNNMASKDSKETFTNSSDRRDISVNANTASGKYFYYFLLITTLELAIIVFFFLN